MGCVGEHEFGVRGFPCCGRVCHFGCLQGGSMSVPARFRGIDAVMALTLILLKYCAFVTYMAGRKFDFQQKPKVHLYPRGSKTKASNVGYLALTTLQCNSL